MSGVVMKAGVDGRDLRRACPAQTNPCSPAAPSTVSELWSMGPGVSDWNVTSSGPRSWKNYGVLIREEQKREYFCSFALNFRRVYADAKTAGNIYSQAGD